MESIGYAYLGMHMVWWIFWVGLMVLVFGFNLPEQARRSKNDPLSILQRRYASGELSELDYEKMKLRLNGLSTPARQTAIIQSPSHGFGSHPLIDGLTFSASWIIMYSLCAVVYWISPVMILTATSKLFHGLSFTQMAQQGSEFGFGDYLSVVTIGAFYVFIAGALTSAVHAFLLQLRTSQLLAKKSLRRGPMSPLAT